MRIKILHRFKIISSETKPLNTGVPYVKQQTGPNIFQSISLQRHKNLNPTIIMESHKKLLQWSITYITYLQSESLLHHMVCFLQPKWWWMYNCLWDTLSTVLKVVVRVSMLSQTTINWGFEATHLYSYDSRRSAVLFSFHIFTDIMLFLQEKIYGHCNTILCISLQLQQKCFFLFCFLVCKTVTVDPY